MVTTINGIHHISAIVGNVNEALDFYERILGLRLIKQTVNFDDPNTYHLYFSNANVEKGTVFTFFPWESKHIGRKGSGQVGRIAFFVGKGHLDYWKERLAAFGISVEEGKTFDRPSIDFTDQHALELSIVESDKLEDKPALLGFYGSEIWSFKPEASRTFFVEQLGFTFVKETDSHLVLQAGDREHYVYIPKEAKERGAWGVGTVHHIAFSVKDSQHQQAIHDQLAAANYITTEVKDRKYFQAIYVREVGGVILEFATEGPGFTVDEDLAELGNHLMLPAHYESRRQEIIEKLIPIQRKVD